MCGIFGYFDRRGIDLPPDRLESMGRVIRHRGPDDQGIYRTSGMAIGNQRLSIIDIGGGHQPFVSDDGQVVVVQNGEIFNHVELAQELEGTPFSCRTRSDTEVLLRLYEKEGIGFVSKLNGMFAIAIIDHRSRAMYLVRDRIGVKPLYIHDDGNRVAFGSEIKSILEAGVPAAFNPVGYHHYLTYNYVPAPHTIFENIWHVKPGHFLRIDAHGSKETRWWNLAEVQPVEGRSESDWIEEFNHILDDAVRIRLRADVPFGAFLSGGVDSSTVVGLMTRHTSQPVKTFCIGFDDPRFDESIYAQQAADRFGTAHTMQRVAPNMLGLWPMATWHCDQPHGDVSFLPTYKVSELAAKHVKMVLTGDGADEMFGGYDKYVDFFSRQDVSKMSDAEFQRAYYQNISLFGDTAKQRLYGQQLARELAGVDSFDVIKPLFAESRHQDRINQALYIDMQLLLSGNNLVKPDRMGMAVSLEARTPFLDYRMMEFAFRMPGHLKVRDGVSKYLYKKAVTPLIGEELAYRKKQMFTVPVGEWFKNELAGYVRETLLAKDNAVINALEQAPLASMIDEHTQGTKNNTRELRALIASALWSSKFMPCQPSAGA
ncbi:asparagine synthase (glutamine-hydrolyzing) [Janthinobacterium sp. 17J80-10]|uniref:asparagine synthase (glutamine-hydrolyzing) n=1 Tax=Janthinobacterium sp. 17J80-10 TaxID=2497863 RepID=UPI0010056277|nr:asparagine synthase (glutamine-hydrolyzing) [Janthinobacterium sp. 17J80-10]QAU33069.1 asparagine synthase (glutamine-hydrolyzing) [Janthinobacterium sp. 17J80-10]